MQDFMITVLPLGVELRNNIKAAWWRDTVHRRDDVVGLPDRQ